MGRLSIEKINDFFSRHNYEITSFYTIGDSCSFIECKTPKYSKPMVVRVPSKYTLTIEDGNEKKIPITPLDIGGSKQSDYAYEIKRGVPCSLLVIGSNNLALSSSSGDAICYYFGEHKEEEVVEEVEEEDDVSRLERQVDHIEKKTSLEDTEEEVVEEEVDVEEIIADDSKEREEEGSVNEEEEELVFEVNDDKRVESDEEEVIEECLVDTNPSDLTDNEISIGLIYVVIELGKFFSKVDSVEESVYEIYNILEDNENDMRKERLESVKEDWARIIERSTERLEEIEDQLQKIKEKSLRLSIILLKTESMKSKIGENKKFEELSPDVLEVYRKSKKTISELNIDKLKLRDEYQNTIQTLEDVIEMMSEK